jgi:hypothetical protein
VETQAGAGARSGSCTGTAPSRRVLTGTAVPHPAAADDCPHRNLRLPKSETARRRSASTASTGCLRRWARSWRPPPKSDASAARRGGGGGVAGAVRQPPLFGSLSGTATPRSPPPSTPSSPRWTSASSGHRCRRHVPTRSPNASSAAFAASSSPPDHQPAACRCRARAVRLPLQHPPAAPGSRPGCSPTATSPVHDKPTVSDGRTSSVDSSTSISRWHEMSRVSGTHTLGPCTCLVCISAGGWFEHGSNVCPGVWAASGCAQAGDLRRWRSACPGAFSCGTRGGGHRT